MVTLALGDDNFSCKQQLIETASLCFRDTMFGKHFTGIQEAKDIHETQKKVEKA